MSLNLVKAAVKLKLKGIKRQMLGQLTPVYSTGRKKESEIRGCESD